MHLFDKFIPDHEGYTGEGLRMIAGFTHITGNSKPKLASAQRWACQNIELQKKYLGM